MSHHHRYLLVMPHYLRCRLFEGFCVLDVIVCRYVSTTTFFVIMLYCAVTVEVMCLFAITRASNVGASPSHFYWSLSHVRALSLSLFTGKKDTMAMRILHPTSCLPRHYDQSRLEFKAHSITQFEFLWNTFANLSFVTSCAHGDECHYSSSPCPFVCQCTMDLPNQTPWYGNHPSNRLQTPSYRLLILMVQNIPSVLVRILSRL